MYPGGNLNRIHRFDTVFHSFHFWNVGVNMFT